MTETQVPPETTDQKLTVQTIAERLNVIPKEIRRAAQEHSIFYHDPTYELIEVFCMLKALRILTGQGDPFRLDDIDKNIAKHLHTHGHSYNDIAFALDRAKSSVYEYLRKEGLEQ